MAEIEKPYKIVYSTRPPSDLFVASDKTKITDLKNASRICEDRCKTEGGKYSGLWWNQDNSSSCNCERGLRPQHPTTMAPIVQPTAYQTMAPTAYQTMAPTAYQTMVPTTYQTMAPVNPTANPTFITTRAPITPYTGYETLPVPTATPYFQTNKPVEPTFHNPQTTYPGVKPNEVGTHFPVTNELEIPELPLLPIPDKKHINLNNLELPAEFPLYENIKNGKFKYSFADTKYSRLLHGLCHSVGGKFNGTYSVSNGKVYIHCAPSDHANTGVTSRPVSGVETRRPEQMILIPPQVPGYGTMKSMKNRYQPVFDKVCSLANKVSDGSYTLKDGNLYANCINKL